MRCPSCGKLDDKVIESRTMASGDTIRRRRECISCHFRFTSYEKVEEKPFMVVNPTSKPAQCIKRDGRREPFDRSKIEKGIERAIEKRSIATTTVENLVIEVEEESFSKGAQEREINTSEIGEMILDKLYRLDKVAYIRFASAYKHFENLEEFITEIKNIEQHNKVNI